MNAVVSTFDERWRRIHDRFADTIAVMPYEDRFLDGTLVVAREIHAHSIYRDLELDEPKVIKQLSMAGDIVPDRFFRIAVRGDEVLGGFFGCVLKTFFNDDFLAKDMGWWVKSSSRGGAAAVLLLGAFEEWARSKRARKIMIGHAGVERIEENARLFTNCGYVMCGFNTAKDL